MKSMTP